MRTTHPRARGAGGQRALAALTLSTALSTALTAALAAPASAAIPGGSGAPGHHGPAVRPARFFDAHANGGQVSGGRAKGDTGDQATGVTAVAPLAPSDVACDADGGADDARLDGVTLPGAGTLGPITTKASGAADAKGRRAATASATVSRVNLLGGLVTADLVTATATAAEDARGRVGTSSGASFRNLRVDGVPVGGYVTGLTIDLPSGGKVVVNERVPVAGGDGVGVNALHIRSGDGRDIVVGHVRAALVRQEGLCSAPAPKP